MRHIQLRVSTLFYVVAWIALVPFLFYSLASGIVYVSKEGRSAESEYRQLAATFEANGQHREAWEMNEMAERESVESDRGYQYGLTTLGILGVAGIALIGSVAGSPTYATKWFSNDLLRNSQATCKAMLVTISTAFLAAIILYGFFIVIVMLSFD
jgi:hypothetical protein